MNATDEPNQSESEPTAVSVETRPTYAPVALALGIMFLFWGVVTLWVMSVAGGLLMIWALWTWINELRVERSEP